MEESVKAGVVDVCVDMQQRARDMAERYRREMGRFYYVTPTSYLELINTFKVKYRGLLLIPVNSSLIHDAFPWRNSWYLFVSI